MAKTMTFDIHQLVKVHDGDTLTVVLDRGFNDFSTRNVRVKGVDTPELMGPTKKQGEKARDAAVAWLSRAKVTLRLVSYAIEGDDKYGRILGDVVCDKRGSLSKYLLDNKLAQHYDGGTKTPWTPEALAAVDAFIIPPAPTLPPVVQH